MTDVTQLLPKLGHSLPAIRGRALGSLRSKLAARLVEWPSLPAHEVPPVFQLAGVSSTRIVSFSPETSACLAISASVLENTSPL